MRTTLRNMLSPILNYFEKDGGDFIYRPSHRRILIIVGCLFLLLSVIGLIVSVASGQLGGVFPIIVFFAVGFVCMVVGGLGSDKAVARVWKSR